MEVRTRLTRAETKERNRRAILDAAAAEFGRRGYVDASIDAIAEAAGLTHGAVYSNFSGKRGLFLAVLADVSAGAVRPVPSDGTLAGTLRAIASASVGARDRSIRDLPASSQLWGFDLLRELSTDPALHRAYRQVLALEVAILARALEGVAAANGERPGEPLDGVAAALMGLLLGAAQLRVTDPDLLPLETITAAAGALAGLPSRADPAPPAGEVAVREVGEPWSAPEATDVLTGAPARMADATVLAVGATRLGAVGTALRAWPAADAASALVLVLVTSDRDELTPLLVYLLGGLGIMIRAALPSGVIAGLQVVVDAEHEVCAALGSAAGDDLEIAVRSDEGRLVARAEGPGAALALSHLTTL